MSDDGYQQAMNSVALKARLGDEAATAQLLKSLTRIGHQWLEQHGISHVHDREDIVQEVVVRFLNDWDSGRSSAYTFLVRVLLPTARARYFRTMDRDSRRIELAASERNEAEESFADSEEPAADLLKSLLRKRSSFLNSREKAAIRCRLSHPHWTAQQIASACGVNGSVVSIATRYKLPLELMNRWAFSRELNCAPTDLSGFLKRLNAWHGSGDSSLAATGLDILLAGFSAKHQAETLTFLGSDGDPAILPLIVLRTQIALAQQELALADRLLNWLNSILHDPSLDRVYAWRHRLHYARGRWHTASFHYAEALTAYKQAFEVPEAIWRRDPVFLHSVAVAYRGVQKYSFAEDFINRSLGVYAEQGRIADVAHTISRKARINMEWGEAEHRPTALAAAEDGLEQVQAEYPAFSDQSPMGYVQYRLHRLRFSALVHRDPDDIQHAIRETLTLINLNAYAHEFLELQEVCEQYDLFSRIRELAIKYAPQRLRFGQRRMNRLRAETIRRIVPKSDS